MLSAVRSSLTYHLSLLPYNPRLDGKVGSVVSALLSLINFMPYETKVNEVSLCVEQDVACQGVKCLNKRKLLASKGKYLIKI
jgi:hypothetical protein